MTDPAYSFIILARKLAVHFEFGKAFNMYLCAFDKHPDTRRQYGKEFHDVLTRLSDYLGAAGYKAEIFANYERAIQHFPNSVRMLNEIGKHLCSYGYHSEALCHFEKALNIDNSHANIEKNLNQTKRFLMPRYKFRILNDKVRNDAYRRAIKSCVKDTDSVVNTDAGVGLLALYANACSPASTAACEDAHTMARLSECIAQDNDAERVVIVNKATVMTEKSDLGGARTVLITDAFDAALLGDYVLQSLCHAWENLLNTGAKVIPARAEFFVVGVKCDQLHNHFQLCASSKKMLNIASLKVHKTTLYGESYYGDEVHLYKDLKYMTKSKSLFKISFNHYNDVFEKLHKRTPYDAVLRAKHDGEINAIIGYFNLHLTDNITITSDPRCESRVSAWQQAVFIDYTPKQVTKNEKIPIQFMTNGGRLITVSQLEVNVNTISFDVLRFLNDSEYMRMIGECLGTVCIYLGQTMDVSYVDILDLSPFPMFGVLMMMRGAQSLLCQATTSENTQFIVAVLRANGIPTSKVHILKGDHWCDEVFKDKKFHLIFGHILDARGDIDVQKNKVLENVIHANLHTNGLVLPAKLALMGQLVESEMLETNNRVSDENVGYKMAMHVNKYQVSQVLNVDFSVLEYTPLSEEFVIADNYKEMKSEMVEVPVVRDGECTAILCWYKIQLLAERDEVSTKRSEGCVPGTAFMSPVAERLFRGDDAIVLKCVDPDGSFRLMLDVESY